MASPQELEGLTKLRGGLLFSFLAALFTFIAILSTIALAVTLGNPDLGFIFLVLAFIFGVIALTRMYRGFSNLSPYVPNARMGKIGVILFIIPYANFVGTILVGIALYSVGDKYQEGKVKIGGILAAIPFISFIGYIITYIGLGSLIQRISTGQYVPPSSGTGWGPTGAGLGQGWGQQQSSPGQTGPWTGSQVYQVGTGILSGNTAQFQLYSQGQVSIVRVTLEGADTAPLSVYPPYLSPGINQVTVTFSSLPGSLTKGGQYRIKLELGDGTTTYATVVVT